MNFMWVTEMSKIQFHWPRGLMELVGILRMKSVRPISLFMFMFIIKYTHRHYFWSNFRNNTAKTLLNVTLVCRAAVSRSRYTDETGSSPVFSKIIFWPNMCPVKREIIPNWYVFSQQIVSIRAWVLYNMTERGCVLHFVHSHMAQLWKVRGEFSRV